MNQKLDTSSLSQTNGNSRFYESLAEEQPLVYSAIRICSVPLRFTLALVDKLLRCFTPNIDVATFRLWLEEVGLAIQQDEDEWRLNRRARRYFLDKLEREDPTFAQRVHAAVLDYLEATMRPTLDEDRDRLQQAYHTTPSDQDAGAALYWSVYCRARASNRFAMLPVLARLAESQAHWLTDHEQDIMLYRAAALYYEGPVESKQRAAELLESVLEQGASAPIIVDASFLLGTLKEQADRDEAARLYEQATELRDTLDFQDKNPDVQHHLRLTLAKSFFNLAGTLQARGDPQTLDEVEFYYRHGIQIVSEVEPAYEATQLRHLIGVLQKRGEEDKVKGPIRRISQIERPFRQTFLGEALSKFQESGDIGDLYYAISALNHGLGYDSQLVRIEVEQNGAARLIGTYTLRATSVLGGTDFYLKTVPESKIGVHFESLESLTPTFTLDFKRLSEDDPETERVGIIIAPPMRPGDQLTYRWTLNSDAGTFAITPQELKKTGLDYEYVFWDIIVPMKRLEIQVIIPAAQTRRLPPTWFDLWRIGRWRAPMQTQTAYRAFLEDEPGRVRYHAEMKPPDKVQLGLEVSYPWLAVRYVLAWGVK
jgi:hypothetical protein